MRSTRLEFCSDRIIYRVPGKSVYTPAVRAGILYFK